MKERIKEVCVAIEFVYKRELMFECIKNDSEIAESAWFVKNALIISKRLGVLRVVFVALYEAEPNVLDELL